MIQSALGDLTPSLAIARAVTHLFLQRVLAIVNLSDRLSVTRWYQTKTT